MAVFFLLLCLLSAVCLFIDALLSCLRTFQCLPPHKHNSNRKITLSLRVFFPAVFWPVVSLFIWTLMSKSASDNTRPIITTLRALRSQMRCPCIEVVLLIHPTIYFHVPYRTIIIHNRMSIDTFSIFFFVYFVSALFATHVTVNPCDSLMLAPERVYDLTLAVYILLRCRGGLISH